MKLPTRDWAKESKPAVTRTSARASGLPLRLLRWRQLREIIPWSRTTCWRAVRDNRFPSPVRLSKNAVAWRSDQVFEWVERRERS